MNLYNIIFSDDKIYEGGTINDTKWKEIPSDKKIRSLFYSLPTGDMICLSGYDKYYQFIEATTDLNGENKGKQNIEFLYVIGKLEDQNTIYKIDAKSGKIDCSILSDNSYFISHLNQNFWKEGFRNVEK